MQILEKSIVELICFFYVYVFQETTRSPKTASNMSPDEMDDLESPAPQPVQPPGRRRGAISAEPIREEDIESYVKKVVL